MIDVLIAGAGPAGSIAALLLARAGARVLLVDRERFPREKLCGDTLNPGAVAFLDSIGLTDGPVQKARPLRGMLVTGPHARARVEYDGAETGRAIVRRELDEWLLQQAIGAGATFEPGLAATGVIADDERGAPQVRGLVLRRQGREQTMSMEARMTIAADGRRSAIARAAGLTAGTNAPRRWAYGVYATGVRDVGDVGEMHVRRGWYLGIAPITDAVSNVCLVTGPRAEGRAPLEIVRRAIARDAWLSARFEPAQFVTRVNILGPLAADVSACGRSGLLLAGDAAGFVDPMTGDGLSLAMRGAALAAVEALRALGTGQLAEAPLRLAEARRHAFAAKLRFNRLLRALVDQPAAVVAAEIGAKLVPPVLRRVVRYAGDVPCLS